MKFSGSASRVSAGWLFSGLMLLCSGEVCAQNMITALNVGYDSSMTIIKIDLARPLSRVPDTEFIIGSSPHIVLEFPDTASGLDEPAQDFTEGGLRSANIIQSGGRTRLVLYLNQMFPSSTRIDGNSLLVILQGNAVNAGSIAFRLAETKQDAQRLALNSKKVEQEAQAAADEKAKQVAEAKAAKIKAKEKTAEKAVEEAKAEAARVKAEQQAKTEAARLMAEQKTKAQGKREFIPFCRSRESGNPVKFKALGPREDADDELICASEVKKQTVAKAEPARLKTKPVALAAPIDGAKKLLQQGQAAKSMELLESHLTNSLQDVEFNYLLGIASLDAGKPGNAVFAFERALAIDPSHPQARAELARALIALVEFDAARRELLQVKSMNPPPEVAAKVDKALVELDRLIAESKMEKTTTWAT